MKNNKLMADFMGWKIDYENPNIDTTMKHHESWDWLMPVVEKIEDLDLSEWMYKWEDLEDGIQYNFEGISVEIERNRCWIYVNLALDPMFTINEKTFNKTYNSKIEATYAAVVEFVEWYNERKKREENERNIT
jgi:hypothetical protein